MTCVFADHSESQIERVAYKTGYWLQSNLVFCTGFLWVKGKQPMIARRIYCIVDKHWLARLLLPKKSIF